MAYADQATLAADDTFRGRIRDAVMTAAVAIMGEAKTTDDAVFGKRQALAEQMMTSGGASHLEAFTWAVVANNAISAGSTDDDIQFTVNSVWDDVAGVRSDD